MRYSLLLLFINSFLFAQIEETPQKFSKIKFIYQSTTNYKFTDEGVYADTILIKKDFTDIDFKKVVSTDNPKLIVGFIAKGDLKKHHLSKLENILIHNNSTSEFIYDLKKNTIINKTSLAKDEKTQAIFKDFFNEKIDGIDCLETKIEISKDSTIKYLKRNIKTVFDYTNRVINWMPNYTNKGTFDNEEGDFIIKYVISVNPKLNKFINPLFPFSNCEFGIEKIQSIPTTITLISVSYK